MDHELICMWLELPVKYWPPDHYTLLGLKPGECDCARIEQQVHERLSRVRCYQLSHPGPATEAMNRLAQAYTCLTDRQAKSAYDAEHFPHLAARARQPAPAPRPPGKPRHQAATRPAPPDASSVDTAVMQPVKTQVDWRDAGPPPLRVQEAQTPPPVRYSVGEATPPPVRILLPQQPATAAPPAPATPVSPDPPTGATVSPATPAPPQPAPAPTPPAVDPVDDLARSSRDARRGLGTRRALYERILTTRHLQRAWSRAGKYLARPKRRLTRTVEETEFTRLLTQIDELLADFPPLLGEPGKPGYRVVALLQDDDVVGTFNRHDAADRDALALDWSAGQALLTAHRRFLLQQLKTRRRCNLLGRMALSIKAALLDHPVWTCIGLLVVIGVAVATLLVD